MTYKGIARGRVIELEDDLALPEGTEVEIVVKDRAKSSVTIILDLMRYLFPIPMPRRWRVCSTNRASTSRCRTRGST